MPSGKMFEIDKISLPAGRFFYYKELWIRLK